MADFEFDSRFGVTELTTFCLLVALM
jgi:hypothetical protein